ncbi:hypothetical protein [Photobacterium leiognathi]|uniref:hypothetical protein n=2 Tax=Photobacterium leiognathi TaxID=553611 RepID=UPI0027367399|nr:hypothetical protein [Photobacterium leiognathi]
MKMNIQDLCLIEASGTFLCEHLDDEIIQSETDILNHIDMNKCEFVENECNEAVFNMITDLADSLERFLGEAIRNSISNQDIDAMSKVVVSDVWYDAKKHDDTAAQETIENGQRSITNVVQKLQVMMGDSQ